MTIDLRTGVYLRSERPRLLFGGARPDQADGYGLSVDWPWMETLLPGRARHQDLAVRQLHVLEHLPLMLVPGIGALERHRHRPRVGAAMMADRDDVSAAVASRHR
jgi:hypothetical protein